MSGKREHRGGQTDEQHPESKRDGVRSEKADHNSDGGECTRADHRRAFADAGDEPSARNIAEELTDGQ